MPYETGADELKYQKDYAKKRMSEDALNKEMSDTEKRRRRNIWNRVISRAEGAAPERKAASDAGSKGGNVEAPNKASTSTRLQRVFEGLTGTSKVTNPLRGVEKKSRPKP